MAIFNLVSSSNFHSATDIDSTGLYFLHDTGEVYRGSEKYSKAVITYTGTLPTTPAYDTLYVNTSTLAASIYDGSSWTQVVKPVVSTVSTDGTDPVNSTAVISYVADQLAAVTGGSSVVTGVSYDDSTVTMTITDALGETSTIQLDGLAVELAYDSATQSLTVKDAAGSVLGSAVDLSGLVQTNGSSYDTGAGTVTIALGTGAGLVVPIKDYVETFETTYGAEDSTSITLIVTDNKFKAEAIVATTDGNMLTSTTNGLYVAATDTSSLQALVSGATAGDIATLNASGQVVDSGVSIGGATLATSATSSVLATEAAVAAAVAAAVSTLESSISTLSNTVSTNTTNIATNTSAIATLNGTGNGSVSKAVTDAIADVVDGAPAALDTLKEIADWIEDDATGAAAMSAAIATNTSDIATNATAIATNATAISTNATAISTEESRATAAESALSGRISTLEAIDAVETSDIATSLSASSTDAEVVSAKAVYDAISWNVIVD